jgi:hypothetical protein
MGFASFVKLTVNVTMWLPGVVGAKSVASIQIFVVSNQFRGIRVFPNLGHQSSRLNSVGTTVGTSHLENHSTRFGEVHHRTCKVIVGVGFAKCRCRANLVRDSRQKIYLCQNVRWGSVCDLGRRVKRLEPVDHHCPPCSLQAETEATP